jgi:hypothetical protein
MRVLFAALAAVLVALVATPSAHAGSPHRSMPRTLRAPGGMVRCIEAPISLAFDVVEQEAARFADPQTLTSRESREARDLRTPAAGETAAKPTAHSQLRAGSTDTRAVRVALAPCGSNVHRAAVCSSMGNLDTHDQLSPTSADENALWSRLFESTRFAVASRRAPDESTQFARTAVTGAARPAHAPAPWRPPSR